MKTRVERVLHLSTAAVTLAAAFGLDSRIAALLLALGSIGLALTAGILE